MIVCGIALGLAVLGWAVSRKWGRKDWQKGAAVIAAAACLGLLSGYMERLPRQMRIRRRGCFGEKMEKVTTRQTCVCMWMGE